MELAQLKLEYQELQEYDLFFPKVYIVVYALLKSMFLYSSFVICWEFSQSYAA
jgi:hypothetical protein